MQWSERSRLQNHFTAESQLTSDSGWADSLRESRNHWKRNLIAAIKQEKDKHWRPLMLGHLKCLRSVNIFAHKALWWWPCLLWHSAALLCKHSQFNLRLQITECFHRCRSVPFSDFYGPPLYLGPPDHRGAGVAPLSLKAAGSSWTVTAQPQSRSCVWCEAKYNVWWNVHLELPLWLQGGGGGDKGVFAMPEPLDERWLPTK